MREKKYWTKLAEESILSLSAGAMGGVIVAAGTGVALNWKAIASTFIVAVILFTLLKLFFQKNQILERFLNLIFKFLSFRLQFFFYFEILTSSFRPI